MRYRYLYEEHWILTTSTSEGAASSKVSLVTEHVPTSCIHVNATQKIDLLLALKDNRHPDKCAKSAKCANPRPCKPTRTAALLIQPLGVSIPCHWSPSTMDYSPNEHASSRRKPLSDATTRVNNLQSSTPIRGSSPYPSSSARIPHHESRKPGGNLQVPHHLSSPMSPASNAENKRLSAIASQGQTNPNRNSQQSTTSTNASGKPKRKTHVGPWNLGPTIGKGATGRVRKAKHALTGQFAAVKIVSKRSATLVQSDSLAGLDTMGKGKNVMPCGIEREVVIMKLIEHPNVTNLYDIWENRGEL